MPGSAGLRTGVNEIHRGHWDQPLTINIWLLDSIVDAVGNVTAFYYDMADRQVATVYTNLYSQTNRYNRLGQVTNQGDSAGA